MTNPDFTQADPTRAEFTADDVPANAPRTRSRILVGIGRWGLRRMGWRIYGQLPNVPKMIVIVAPHTSNWDWVVGVCGLWALRLKVTYLAKHTLFFWPLGLVMRATGAIPVDRGEAGDVVGSIVEEFKRADRLYYGITPEGTRGAVGRWKTGFLRVAYLAEVPVVPVTLNCALKEITLGQPIELSGATDSDLRKIQNHFDGVLGRCDP